MKQQRATLLLALAFILCLALPGCTGLIPPTIGESVGGVQTDSPEQNPSDEPGLGDSEGPGGGSEGPGGGSEGPGGGEGPGGDESSSNGGDSEPVVAPEMAGSVVYRFHFDEMRSSSLGAMEQFTASAELYDAANAEGNNGVIHIQSGSNESYTSVVWSENEDGSLSVRADEFTTYEAREIGGVLTIVGVRYRAGMSSGTVDIPLAQ